MYREEHDYWNCLHRFLSVVCQFEARVSLVRHFIPGDSQLVRGLISLHFFHRGNHLGRIYRGT